MDLFFYWKMFEKLCYMYFILYFWDIESFFSFKGNENGRVRKWNLK